MNNFQFIGPEIDDFETFKSLPSEFQNLLSEKNGYIQYEGAFHVRGCCHEPKWHSFARYWTGEMALSGLYPNILPDDIPFAENVLGDQIFLRDNTVWYMNGETGNIACYNRNLQEFLTLIEEDPTAHLNCPMLTPFLAHGGVVEPGQLLHAYPPLISNDPSGNYILTPVAQDDQLHSLSQLAAFFRDMDKKKTNTLTNKIKSIFSKKEVINKTYGN